MSASAIAKLCEFIENIIDTLRNYILEKYLLLDFVFKIIKEKKLSFIFEFNFFRELFDSAILDNEKYSADYENAIRHFSEIFIVPIGDFEKYYIHTFSNEIGIANVEKFLFIRVVFHLFKRSFLKNYTCKEKLDRMLKKWKKANKKNVAEVEVIIPLDNIVFSFSKGKMNEKISLRNESLIRIIGEQGTSSSEKSRSHMIINTNLPVYIYRNFTQINSRFDNQDELHQAMEVLKKELQEIVASLYICDIPFEYNDFHIRYPWWYPHDQKDYRQILTRDTYRRFFRVSDQQLKKANNYLNIVKKSKLFSKRRYYIFSYSYIQVYNHDFTAEILINIAILFEILFSPDSQEDLTFWFSFNAAFFLSKNEDDFLENFRFFKQFYRLRSALVHGDRWDSLLERIINNSYGANARSAEPYIIDCQKYLNKSLRKLLRLCEKTGESILSINALKNKEFNIKKIEMLQGLADHYKKLGEFAQNIRILIRALDLFKDLGDCEDIKESFLKKIKQSYDKNHNKIIFREELNKILFELALMMDLEVEHAEDASEALEKLINIQNNKSSEEPNNSLNLKIDGFEIMDILEIKPGPQVGLIIAKLGNKVLEGTLKNERKVLKKYLKKHSKTITELE